MSTKSQHTNVFSFGFPEDKYAELNHRQTGQINELNIKH